MSDSKTESSLEHPISEMTLLLEPFYGEFFAPVYWEESKKAKNYFAHIDRGKKYLFKRDFFRPHYIDDQVVFKKKDLEEGALIEQRCTFVRGTKEEITFGGFFILHHVDKKIYGQEISQKQALEYFDCREMFPEKTEERKNEARVEISTNIRSFMRKYGEELVSEVLIDILNDYFPSK